MLAAGAAGGRPHTSATKSAVAKDASPIKDYSSRNATARVRAERASARTYIVHTGLDPRSPLELQLLPCRRSTALARYTA